MSQIRNFASQYVSRHLNGVTVNSTVDTESFEVPIIATHNGSFHCDEALACALLRHLPPYARASVIRTRDPKLIDKASIAVDVGAVYDHAQKRYDHHQQTFHETMNTGQKQYKTRMSAAGLVYRHYGKELIQQYIRDILQSPARAEALSLGNWGADRNEATEDEVSVLYDAIYRCFVEAVDGVDNGVELFSLAATSPEGQEQLSKAVTLKKNYISQTDLAGRIGALHAWWNEGSNRDEKAENAAFIEAMEMASTEFFQAVAFYTFNWLPGRAVVQKAFAESTTIDPSGRIIVFSAGGCPWKDHLFLLEEEQNVKGRTLYCLFSDGRSWRVQAVPKVAGGFATRKPLPFKGLRDEVLSQASGIPGGIFVHVSGFIGGMTTYEGALQLAKKALEMPA